MTTYSPFIRYLRCDTCFCPMLGIRHPNARKTCHDCGGKALIGDHPAHRERVQLAQERTANWEPPKPSTRPPAPRRPDLGRVA